MSGKMLQCNDCEAKLARACLGLMKAKAEACEKCRKQICRRCAGDHALVPLQVNDDQLPIKKSSIKSYCRACFKDVSVLDYGKSYDVIIDPIGSANNPDRSKVTLLWAHGGGGSRAMFRPHAAALAKNGYRSILMDLPGHGTLVDSTSLTLDSCVEAVKLILDRECSSNQCSHVIYIGGSLGAYVGFHVFSQFGSRFSGAIQLDCGQNVGPDCSLKARVGLWVLRQLSGRMNNKALMSAMMGTVKKSNADYHLVECSFAAGMFFQQGPAQCDCLHTVAPAEIIPSLSFPILFFNGTEDYRDSEDKWLALCRDKERSSLKVYDGGDHFFCHDSRFVEDMLRRMDEFIQASVC